MKKDIIAMQYKVVTLKNTNVLKQCSVSLPGDFFDLSPAPEIEICGRLSKCFISPVTDDAFFYDLFYSGSVLTGLRMCSDNDPVIEQFKNENASRNYVDIEGRENNALPMIWFSDAQEGEETDSGLQQFGEVYVYRDEGGIWSMILTGELWDALPTLDQEC